MKIALINNLYFPWNRGGAEKVVTDMAKNYQSQGHSVFLITTKPPKDNHPLNTDFPIYYLSSNFFNLHKLSLISRFFWHLGNIYNFPKAQQIKKILKSEQPDLVVTHNLMGLGWLIPRVIKKLKINHEHFLHDIQLLHPSGLMFYGQEKKINSLSSRIYQMISRNLFSSPDKVTSPSHWLLDQHHHRKFFPKSSLVVAPFLKQKSQKAIKEINNPQKLLFIGQIENHKGILFLIKAFKKITDPHKTLTIVGEGQKLITAKKLAGSDQRIKFLGKLPWESAEKIMENSDCLIVPSLCYENYPTVILGAHQHGLPVIATNCGGIPEVIEKNDRLFQPGDENSLINKLI